MVMLMLVLLLTVMHCSLGLLVLLNALGPIEKLYEIGKGNVQLFQDEIRCADDVIPCSDESSGKPKQPHCSFCGHPCSKKSHLSVTAHPVIRLEKRRTRKSMGIGGLKSAT